MSTDRSLRRRAVTVMTVAPLRQRTNALPCYLRIAATVSAMSHFRGLSSVTHAMCLLRHRRTIDPSQQQEATTTLNLNPLPAVYQPADHGYMVKTPTALRDSLIRPRRAHYKRLGEILALEGALSEEELHCALERQRQQPATRLGELLLDNGKISEHELYQGLSARFGLPYVRLREFEADPLALYKLSNELVRTYRVLPLMIHQGSLIVAVRDPGNTDILDALSVLTRLPVKAVLATPRDIDRAISIHYPPFEE